MQQFQVSSRIGAFIAVCASFDTSVVGMIDNPTEVEYRKTITTILIYHVFGNLASLCCHSIENE